MTRILVCASILSVAALGAAQTKQSPQPALPDALRLMLRSMPSWKFSGTRVVEIRQGAKRIQDSEHILRDGLKSRTFFPRDSVRHGEVIVETPRERRMYDPKKNTIFVSRGLGMGTDRLNMIARRGAKFTEEKGDRVADRDTKVVAMSDERNRVIQRVWIDSKTGVILKRELYDQVGARESYYEYKTIDFTPTFAPGDFTLSVPGAKVMTPYDVAKEQAAPLGITPVFLPRDKYPLDHARAMRSPGGSFLHMTFATEDGVVSLFQSKGTLPTDRLKSGNRHSVVSWTANGNSFALIGRAKTEKLERLARLLGKS